MSIQVDQPYRRCRHANRCIPGSMNVGTQAYEPRRGLGSGPVATVVMMSMVGYLSAYLK